MVSITKNERGYAVVYALVVLLLASVAGTGLMFMTSQGHIGATDYAKIRSASQAAVAALKACEGQFLNDPITTLAILKKYKEDNDYKWLLGDETNSNTEQRIKFWNGSGSPEYSARILGFDATNYLIKIEGTGYGGIGGKKHVVASYQLGGLSLSESHTFYESFNIDHAFYLGGRLESINEPICIKGNVYLRLPSALPEQQFNNGGIIHGNLKTAQTSSALIIGAKPLIITGTAFFQCRLNPNSSVLSVTGKAGFTGEFYNWNANIELGDDAYFISPTDINKNNKVLGQSGKTVTYNSNHINSSLFTGFGTEDEDNSLDANSIAANLGTTTDTLIPLGYSLPIWGEGVVEEISGFIDGAALEDLWLKHEENKTLYQGKWLVLKMIGNVNGMGGGFTKKAIWITNNKYFYDYFFDCSNESNTLFIVNGFQVFNINIPDNSNFRGLIYINTNNYNNMIYKIGSNSIIYGSIYHASPTGFNINDGHTDSLRIYFSDPIAQSALQEITETGIILPPGAAAPIEKTPEEGAPAEGAIVLVDKKIRPTLLGMQL